MFDHPLQKPIKWFARVDLVSKFHKGLEPRKIDDKTIATSTLLRGVIPRSGYPKKCRILCLDTQKSWVDNVMTLELYSISIANLAPATGVGIFLENTSMEDIKPGDLIWEEDCWDE